MDEDTAVVTTVTPSSPGGNQTFQRQTALGWDVLHTHLTSISWGLGWGD